MKHTLTTILTVVAGSAALTVYAQDNSARSQNSPAQPQQVTAGPAPMKNVHPIALADAPKAVQQSIRGQAHGGVVQDVDQANWNGQTVYSVLIDNHGQFNQYIFNQNGKVISAPAQPVSEAAGAQTNHSK